MPGLNSTKVAKKEKQSSKRRKVVQKTVVTVRIEANVGTQKREGPPSDMWSWRKYGQKPIKGSPYPRGYYRCSTSKGCLAKKQVERCRTDASMLVITYTSTHNHPNPDNHAHPIQKPPQIEPNRVLQTDLDRPFTNQEQEVARSFYFKSPFSPSSGINQDGPLSLVEQSHDEPSAFFFDKDPLPYPHFLTFSTPKSEDNDFFDELEELPISSSFTGFVGNSFFDERILILPSYECATCTS